MILFVTLSGLLLQSPPARMSLEIVGVERRLGGSVFVEWATPPGEIVRRQRVYIDRNAHDRFPSTLVGDVDPHALAWLSEQRRTWSFTRRLFGIDMKDPRQWFQPGVLTPGESYTFGIEQLRLDPKTRAEYRVTASVKVSPFVLLQPPHSINCGGLGSSTVDLQGDLGPELEQWLERRRQEGVALMAVGASVSITHGCKMDSSNNALVFELSDGRRLLYEGTPDRPTILGLPSVARRVVLVPALLGLVVFGGLTYLIARAAKYLNYLAEPSNSADDVLKALLRDERAPLLVLLVLTIVSRIVVLGKWSDWGLWSMPPDSQRVLERLDQLFRRRRLGQFRKIHAEALSILGDRSTRA